MVVPIEFFCESVCLLYLLSRLQSESGGIVDRMMEWNRCSHSHPHPCIAVPPMFPHPRSHLRRTLIRTHKHTHTHTHSLSLSFFLSLDCTYVVSKSIHPSSFSTLRQLTTETSCSLSRDGRSTTAGAGWGTATKGA
jgi:hypothetical protein